MKKLLGIMVAASITFGVAEICLAQTEAPAATTATAEPAVAAPAKADLEVIEFTGTIQVTPPDAAKNQKYASVTIKEGDKEYKLLPGEDKKSFGELEKLAGKVVTVTGKVLPANDKHPLPAIKVDSFKEVVAK